MTALMQMAIYGTQMCRYSPPLASSWITAIQCAAWGVGIAWILTLVALAIYLHSPRGRARLKRHIEKKQEWPAVSVPAFTSFQGRVWTQITQLIERADATDELVQRLEERLRKIEERP